VSSESTKSGGESVSIVDKLLGIVSLVIGQMPWIVTMLTTYPLSLYQPSIYRGKELFLLIPLMAGVFSTWSVLLWQRAMWAVLALFILSSIFVYSIYETAAPPSELHFVSWIVSYCAFAFFVAVLLRTIIDATKGNDNQTP
jgi:hypothetical protein